MNKENKFKKTVLTILTAIMLAMSAGVVNGEGSDPLDPSDGGADWDGDGLTNKEEQDAGTNMNNPDSDGDGMPDGWEIIHRRWIGDIYSGGNEWTLDPNDPNDMRNESAYTHTTMFYWEFLYHYFFFGQINFMQVY